MKSKRRLLPSILAAVLIAATVLAQTSPDVSYPDPSTLPGKGPTNVWNGLAATWAKRRQGWAGHSQQDHGALVFLGDSITQGFEPLSQFFPGVKLANRGIGGDTTRGVLYRLDPDVLNLDPEGIVLLIGTNDLGIGADPDDVIDNIKVILARIKAHNARTPIIVCLVMPRGNGDVKLTGKIRKLNSGIQQAIQGDPQFTLCDTWSLYADANGNCPADLFPDRLHPNKAGNQKWADALKPLLQQRNLLPHS